MHTVKIHVLEQGTSTRCSNLSFKRSLSQSEELDSALSWQKLTMENAIDKRMRFEKGRASFCGLVFIFQGRRRCLCD